MFTCTNYVLVSEVCRLPSQDVSNTGLLNLAESGRVIQTKSTVATWIIGKTRRNQAVESLNTMSVKKLKGFSPTLIEVFPSTSMISIFPSFGLRFMHRLRGELLGSRLDNNAAVLGAANRIKTACIENVADKYTALIKNAGGRTDIIYNDENVGKTRLTVLVSDKMLKVKMVVSVGGSLTVIVQQAVSSLTPSVSWEFQSEQRELLSMFKELLSSEARAYWEEE